MSRKAFWAIVATLCVCGLFLRTYHIGSQSIWLDEAFTLSGARAIAQSGLPILHGGFYAHCILSNYVVAAATGILGFDAFSPWTVRLPFAIFGAVFIAISGLFASSLFGDRKVGVAAAFLAAFTYWEIAWSRQIRGYSLLVLLAVAALYALWTYIESGRRSRYALSWLLIALASAAHGCALIFLPAFILSPALRRALKIQNQLRRFGLLLGMCATSIAIVCIGALAIGYGSSTISLYMRLMPWPMALFFALSLAAMIWGASYGQNSRAMSFLSLAVVPSIFMVLWYSPAMHLAYLLPVFSVCLVAFAYAACAIGAALAKSLGLKGLPSDAAALAVLLAVSWPLLTFAPQSEYRLDAYARQPDFKEVFGEIRRTAVEGDIIISPVPAIVYAYTSSSGSMFDAHVSRKAADGRDYYTGAEIVPDADLKEIFVSSHGYAIIDHPMEIFDPEAVGEVKNHPNVRLIYEDRTAERVQRLWLYRF